MALPKVRDIISRFPAKYDGNKFSIHNLLEEEKARDFKDLSEVLIATHI